jgi:hypothetical protein
MTGDSLTPQVSRDSSLGDYWRVLSVRLKGGGAVGLWIARLCGLA